MNDLLYRIRRTDGLYPWWRLPFELARVLRAAYPADLPDPLEPVVDQFFRLVVIDPVVGWTEFERCWDIVTHPDGADGWAKAVELAVTRPLVITPPPGPKRGVLASVAAYLSEAAGGEPFVFSGEKLAHSLGLPVSTTYRLLDALVKRKVIRWHDARYDPKEGKARVAVFIGRVVGPSGA